MFTNQDVIIENLENKFKTDFNSNISKSDNEKEENLNYHNDEPYENATQNLNTRTVLEINKIFRDINSEYIKKYGGLYKSFDVRKVKNEIWNSIEKVKFF